MSFVLITFALFLTAGTMDRRWAWNYLGISAASSVLLARVFSKDPVLLENRTRLGPIAEKRTIQKIVLVCAGLLGIAAFVVPGQDRRFGGSNVPWWLSTLGDVS